MAEDDSTYKDVAPNHFGEGLCKRAKERDEELRHLNQATPRQSSGPPRGSSHFFSRQSLLLNIVPWERPIRPARVQRWLPKRPSLQRTMAVKAGGVHKERKKTAAKTTPTTYLIGTDLILVIDLLC